MTVYDPCCGSGGLLIKCHLRLLETKGKRANGRLRLPDNVAPLQLFGQEINSSTFAMSRMNAFIHDMEADIALGDTMHRPAFTEGDGRLRQFDIVTANPMWNQKFRRQRPTRTTPTNGSAVGVPPSSSADWGWVQHMVACLNARGRMAVVLDTGAVEPGQRQQGSNKERDIRKQFVEADLVEAVLLLPENLFYNTTAPGIVLVINRKKRHPGEILLINASKLFARDGPRTTWKSSTSEQIADVYHDWKGRGRLSAIITQGRGGEERLQPVAEPVCLHRRARPKCCRWMRRWCCCRRPRKSGPKRIASWMKCWRSWASRGGEMDKLTMLEQDEGIDSGFAGRLGGNALLGGRC